MIYLEKGGKLYLKKIDKKVLILTKIYELYRSDFLTILIIIIDAK